MSVSLFDVILDASLVFTVRLTPKCVYIYILLLHLNVAVLMSLLSDKDSLPECPLLFQIKFL